MNLQMVGVIERVQNRLRIPGDKFHMRKNRPLRECDSALGFRSFEFRVSGLRFRVFSRPAAKNQCVDRIVL
jgi:hypothetical protein